MDLGFDEPLEIQLGTHSSWVLQDSPRVDLGFDEPLEIRDISICTKKIIKTKGRWNFI